MDLGSEAVPPWGGFHHVALVTPDLEATIAFYRDVLAMRIGEIREGGGVLAARHCFIRPGESATWGLHFFEHRGAEIAQFPEGLQSREFIPGGLQHIAFALPHAAAGQALRERLEAHEIEATPTGSIGPLQNTLFFDNNGLLLEATWPRE